MLTRVSRVLMFMVAARLAENVLGATSVSLNNHGSNTLHEITVSPGGSFLTDLNLADDDGFWKLSMQLQASASNVFSVTGFTYNAAFTESGWYTEPPTGSIDPATDIFGIMAPSNFSVGPGNLTIGTASLSVNALAPAGTYVLNTANIIGLFSPFALGFVEGTPGPDFVVSVTPEPASAMLFSCLLLGVFRRRSVSR
jgi:hypothetical protein